MTQKIVLKLGGSAITYKSTAYFPMDIDDIKRDAGRYIRSENVSRLASEIKQAMDESGSQMVVINGAGPFGHYLVAKSAPGDTVRESVAFLNGKVVYELRRAGIDAVPIPPSESCTFDGERFDIGYLWDTAKLLLEETKVPSTYGDFLKSAPEKGISEKIISGDDLAVLIAELWKADMVVMAADVDGYYTYNPKKSGARLIKTVYASSGRVVLADQPPTIGSGDVGDMHDMTGGMEAKVRKLKPLAIKGITGRLINGTVPGNVKAALLGDESFGTSIVS